MVYLPFFAIKFNPRYVNISYMDLMGNDSIRIAAFQNDSE